MTPVPDPLAPDLPIGAHLAAVQYTLLNNKCLIVIAPPGAGKTTLIPLALLGSTWLENKKIILIEPRRLAARAAAERMACLLDEKLGQTIGLRMRLQSTISTKTRIEVVTEGVFTRMVLEDPMLESYGAVLFDEFHERSLEADFGLALARDVQTGLREDLRLIIMSATLDSEQISQKVGFCPVLASEGRNFPVTALYCGRDPQLRLEEEMAKVILRALSEHSGSILAFLPGQAEIHRLRLLLEPQINKTCTDLFTLYGTLDKGEQNRALQISPAGRRKIVLATAVAQTSVTIADVRIVVDGGLSRKPFFELNSGLTRLETTRVTRASADQRMGRAGRTAPGICYRLWEEAANGGLIAHEEPEIRQADLSGLILDLAHWGVKDPNQLLWLDPPPVKAVEQAHQMLHLLEAMDLQGNITVLGRQMQLLPLPPRLARMIIGAEQKGQKSLAALLALVLSEQGLGGDAIDISVRLERLLKDRSRRVEQAKNLARHWGFDGKQPDLSRCGEILMLAYPDRLAKARGQNGTFLMRNGRAAQMDTVDPLCTNEALVVANVSGRTGNGRIHLAAALSLAHLLEHPQITATSEILFDAPSRSLKQKQQRRLGSILLRSQTVPVNPDSNTAHILAHGIGEIGIDALPITPALEQWRERVLFLRRAEGEEWPDVSDDALRQNLDHWLVPILNHTTSMDEIKAEDIREAMLMLLPWNLQQRLDQEAPTHFITPAGTRIALDYTGDIPALAARVQEFYGLDTHPTLAGTKIPILLHLFSPAHRPVQITRDLPGFWRGSWPAIRSEMRGRYPRHFWPDDPMKAMPTAKAKPRS